MRSFDRWKIYLGVAICALTCAGCGSGGSQQAAQQTQETQQIQEKQEIEEAKGAASLIQNEDYQQYVDDSRYLSWPQIAETEAGYYYFVDDYLRYHDKETNQEVYVCTQVNCTHDSDTCDAYFDMRYYRYESGIWYYDGYLYLLGNEHGLTNYVLYRLQCDGTEREKVADLFSFEGEGDYLQSVIMHRGYLYYSLNNDDVLNNEYSSLYQVSCKPGSEPVELYQTNLERSYVYRIKGYGDGVFFQIGEYLDEECEQFKGSIWYCTDQGSASMIVDNAQRCYNIVDGKVYYTTDTSMNIYDIKTEEDSVFCELGMICDISYDSKYIYLDNFYGVLLDDNIPTDTRTVYVMTYDGEVVESWNIPLNISAENCLFGNEEYLWMIQQEEKTGETRRVLCAMEKSQMGTEDEAWTPWR